MKRHGAQNELESFHLGHLSTDVHSWLDSKLSETGTTAFEDICLNFSESFFFLMCKKADFKYAMMLSLAFVWKFMDGKH